MPYRQKSSHVRWTAILFQETYTGASPITTTKTTPTLTRRQRAVFDFLLSHAAAHGYPPTIRDIAARFDIKSPNGVLCHVNALVKKGLIERDPEVSRGIRIVEEHIDHQARSLAGAVNRAIEKKRMTPEQAVSLAAELQAVLDRLSETARGE